MSGMGAGHGSGGVGRQGGPRWRTSQIVGLSALVLVALLGLTSGLGGVLVFAGLYLMGTGLYAVLRHRSWLGSLSRNTAVGVLAGGLVVMMVGGAVAGAPATKPTTTARTSTAASPSRSPHSSTSLSLTPSPTVPSLADQAALLPAPELAPQVDVAAAGANASPQTAMATALLLQVKGRAPKTGYAQDQFGPAWQDIDGNGCDQRNDVLARDLTAVTLKTGSCEVSTGSLADPYGGTTIAFVGGAEASSAVQIDHVVALSDAWQKGAQQWDAAKRVKFANDLVNLLAVDGPLNVQKGDGDAATWLPPNKAYWCQYVARQVGVKYTYGLWVAAAEQNAMVSVLTTCPNQPLPLGVTPPPAPTQAPAPAAPAPAAPAPAPAAPAPAPAAPAPAPAAPAIQEGVHPGAFCKPAGAFGHTTTGLLMQCKTSATDTRNRWRAA